MPESKERKHIIALLAIIIINVIFLPTMLVLFAGKVQQYKEKFLKISEGEWISEPTISILQEETNPDDMLELMVTAPTIATMPTEEESVAYIKTVEGAVQELIEVDGNDWVVELTEEEFKTFCILVFAESGGESLEGQIAVAAVVINRMLDEEFPDTCYGVMMEEFQFEVVQNGRLVSSITDFEQLPDKTIEAVLRALQGEDPTEELLLKRAEELGVAPEKYAEGGALFFYNPKYCRRNVKVEISIGNHNFHKVW